MTVEIANTDAVLIEGLRAKAPALVLCEHASCDFSREFGNLGLSSDVMRSHVAWDPGALDLARHIARGLGAPLVAGAVSRLVYDCNRPPEAPDAIPAKSEIYDIPGNLDLTDVERERREALIYRPFCAAVDRAIETARPAALITVHSFTPVYFGTRRDLDIGVLHDTDTRLADEVLNALSGSDRIVRRNQPYGPEDGVTHSLKKHAQSRGLLNVMLEVRNDLLADPADVARIAGKLTLALTAALTATDALTRGGD
ncbi:N-formylglutamate amidohydrolase [Arenibacterium sp. CAU 1754]